MTASLYAAQAALTTDPRFRDRVFACVQQETSAWADPPTAPVTGIVDEILPEVAASPGFASTYLWGDATAGVAPGQEAISDAEILATVQPMLDVYRPTAG